MPSFAAYAAYTIRIFKAGAFSHSFLVFFSFSKVALKLNEYSNSEPKVTVNSDFYKLML